jgi:hypothetical protein
VSVTPAVRPIVHSSSRGRRLGALALAAALAACGDNLSPAHDDGDGDGEPTYDAPLYAVASTVSTADSSTTYINLLGDLGPQELDYDQALEYPGWTTILGVDGALLVADGESPIVTRFEVDDTLSAAPAGELGFGNHASAVAFFSHIFVGPERGYFELEYGGLDLLAWNPREMTIEGVIEGPEEIPAERGGFTRYAAYDRGVAVRGDRVFQPHYWVDEDWYRFAPTSQIAVFDTSADQAVAVIEAPCPNLDVATADEDGNLYFSNWVYSVTAPVLGADGVAPSCMVRIAAGQETIDESSIIQFRDLTDGREAAAFRYLGDGRGLLTVFHHERLTGDENPADAAFTTNWRFWTVDLGSGTAALLDGLDHVAPGYYAFQIEGQTLLLVPDVDLSETVVYSLSPDGALEQLFVARGWAYQLVQIR